MKTCFVEMQLKPETLDVIGQANAIIEEYAAQDLRMTLRQLYYQFVSRELLVNTVRNYKRLGGIISDGRLVGLVDWSAIEDRGRAVQLQHHDESVESAVTMMRNIAKAYTLDKWEGQDTYVELWVEKQALAGVLEPVADRYDVPLMVNKGYSSSSAMHEAADRFDRGTYGGERPGLCLYLGDHDPSGEDMVRDIRERFRVFRVDVEVQKVALTMAQVRQYRPPPNPTKMSDSRAAAYVRQHGRRSWELDALRPEVLVKLASDAVAEVIDVVQLKRIQVREAKERALLIKALAKVSA